MTKETGTLREIGARPGDLVQCAVTGRISEVGDPTETGFSYVDTYGNSLGTDTIFGMVARETLPDTPKTWGEMTDEEKGALLLAHHEGKVIEGMPKQGMTWVCHPNPLWFSSYFYRIKPEPKRETVQGWWNGKNFHNTSNYEDRTHIISFDTLDGEPVLDSIRMEKIGEGDQ